MKMENSEEDSKGSKKTTKAKGSYVSREIEVLKDLKKGTF